MGSRRKARESAMQMLYQYDVARPPIDELLETYWSELRPDVDEDVRRFATSLVVGTIEHLETIDRLLASRAEHWRIERMATVDRNILRLAVYELLYETETPKVVIINEAIEIARRYSTYEATQFINGLLDAIRRHLEAASPQGPRDLVSPTTVDSPSWHWDEDEP
ncbi:MAG: transcription antitermination factor NusB [Blastocatellia bacterium]|nr:transcription antitermination factor NusB [Blastocatellia bacterium]MCS7158346.1 transcription antitermination factor NusB [Blastocatellia bacterium]MCX7752852.1 transcription antitermination factor NusB [Blastocatellia bacterium]MDW8167908.1 transcription antitermination factor NusB [Acidobacteriota bacterium]MDW8255933.1 transcription antitermination factor NusB [Acidobacteriota bacterium]